MIYNQLSLMVILAAGVVAASCQPKAPETQRPENVDGESARFEGQATNAPAPNTPQNPVLNQDNSGTDADEIREEPPEEPTEYQGLPTSENPRFNKPRGN